MVKVREHHPLHTTEDIDLKEWVARLADKAALDEDEAGELLRACEFTLQLEQQAEAEDNLWGPEASSFRTGLEMADILADLHVNSLGLVAAVLYRSVREGRVPLQVVKKYFGKSVVQLIDGVQHMAVISTLRNDSEQGVFGFGAGRQAAKIREMLVSVIDDVRVALIKIAERTCAIRAVKNAPEAKRVRVAREVFDVYAPLAHRLGIGHLKWELEDLAFRYLEPIEYKRIARQLDEKRLDRQEFIEEVLSILNQHLADANIEGEINGRAKHIYSIWRKMQRKGIPFSQVYDIRAVRILVSNVAECYTVLGIVHSLWRNVPDEFDDYIASPKENGYRSLHTAVMGPNNKVLEVQIRTQEMHDEAELGVCAHWRYKGGDAKSSADSYEEKIAWLRQVLEWHEELEGEDDQAAAVLHADNSPDRIYVFTPDGHVIDLPQDATPLDFAYRVHTLIGHRCRGAKVNGRIVPLNSGLKTADQVEVITGTVESPSRDWLLSSLGYLNTARARAKVQQWFRKQDRDKNIQAGKALINKELHQLSMPAVDMDALAERFNKQGEDGLYAAIGAGDVGVTQFLHAAQAQVEGEKEPEFKISRRAQYASRYQDSDIYIYGIGNLMSQIAKCCNPLPGDPIMGYITHGRGVSIHRQDCGNLLRMQNEEPERVLEVSWGGAPKRVYPVKVRLLAYDRAGLIRDVTAMLDKVGVNISELATRQEEYKADPAIQVDMKLEVLGIDELSKVMGRLRQITNVIDVQRVND